MFNKILLMSAVVCIFFSSGIASAKSSSVSSDEVSIQHSADLVFKIDYRSIAYREDGYMLICVGENNHEIAYCRDKHRKLTTEDFFRSYFSKAPKIRVVAVGATRFEYVFWLNR